MLMENAGINSAVQQGRTAVNSQVNNHGVDKTEISKQLANGLRKTMVLVILFHSQLMDNSMHDCSRRESMYCMTLKRELSFKNNGHTRALSLCGLARMKTSAQFQLLAGVKSLSIGRIKGSELGRERERLAQMSVISLISVCHLPVVS